MWHMTWFFIYLLLLSSYTPAVFLWMFPLFPQMFSFLYKFCTTLPYFLRTKISYPCPFTWPVSSQPLPKATRLCLGRGVQCPGWAPSAPIDPVYQSTTCLRTLFHSSQNFPLLSSELPSAFLGTLLWYPQQQDIVVFSAHSCSNSAALTYHLHPHYPFTSLFVCMQLLYLHGYRWPPHTFSTTLLHAHNIPACTSMLTPCLHPQCPITCLNICWGRTWLRTVDLKVEIEQVSQLITK